MSPEKERQHYTDAICKLIVEYDHLLCTDQPEQAYTTIVQKYLDMFVPVDKRTPASIALVRTTFISFENFTMLMDFGEDVAEECRNICGHLINILIDIALDDWEHLNNYTLT